MGAPTLEAQAVALFQAGHFAEAQIAFRAILLENPRSRDALLALGIIAAHARRLEEAERLLERALEVDPRSYPALYHLGSVLRQMQRLARAAETFERAIAVDARAPEAYIGLGNARRELGERIEARAAFDAALAIDPRSPAARYNLALLEIDGGDFASAESNLVQAVEREPRDAAAWNNLGLVLRKKGDKVGATSAFERAVAADPEFAEALVNLGGEVQDAQRIDEAIALYERAIAARPGFAPAFTRWGNALKDRGDLHGALARYRQALACDPHEPGALLNSGSIALERGERAEARRFFERALESRPDFPDARYALGLLALFEHDFVHGWAGYEMRFQTDPPAASIAAPRRPPLASGGPTRAHRLAVRMEQGLGDQILFSTLLPELRAIGTSALVEIDARLIALYRRSIPAFEYVSPAQAPAALAKCDAEIAIGSLPALFRRSVESFDAQPRELLAPDPARVAAMHAALAPGYRVAISWRSFQKAGRRHIAERKSIPLECFAALALPGVRLVDVQYGDVAGERSAFDELHPGLRVQVPDLDLRDDMDGVFAAIAACDLVVTASNVTAHFAGAIGRRAWLLCLGANPPFHYWAARADGRSLWYPSVEVLTDPSWTRWETAFEAVAARLAATQVNSGTI
jgi:tetratricopeptide (TPR) repeat protein